MRQPQALKRQRVFFMRNTYAPNQPHYAMVEPILKAIREGVLDKPRLLAMAPGYFDFVNETDYDTIVHLITGGIMGEPLSYSVDKTLASLMAMKYLTMGHEVKAVCIVRRQDKYLESYYLQKVQGGASMSFDEFLEQVDLEAVSWNKVVDIAEGVFGPGNVDVFPFETIYSGEQAFLRRFISCFADPDAFEYDNLDIPKNRSYSEVALRIALVGNSLLEPEERKLLRGFLQEHFSNATHPRARLMTPEQSAEILGMHAEGNKALLEKYCPEHDAAALGYTPA
jgi:hypothetical protein